MGSLAEAPHSDHRRAGTDFLTLRRLTPRRAAFHSGNNTRLMSAEKALGIVTLPKAYSIQQRALVIGKPVLRDGQSAHLGSTRIE